MYVQLGSSKCGFAGIATRDVIRYTRISCFFYIVIFKFKNVIPIYRIAPFIAIPAKPHFDEPSCTIHVHTFYTGPVLLTTVCLKVSLRVRNMYM